MAFDIPSLVAAARDTIQEPRSGARALLRMGLPPIVGGLGLILMAVASAGLSTIAFLASTPEADPALDQALGAMFANPIQLAIIQGLALVFGAFLIHWVGGLFGGKGTLAEAILLVAWLEFILLLLQIAQLLILPVSPSLAAMLGLFGFVLFLWLLTNFVAELHAFPSVLPVFFGIIGTTFAVSFAAAILIVAIVGVP